MATCPKCQGAMKVTEGICSHCGYDFPLADTRQRWGLSDAGVSSWGDAILLLNALVTGMFALLGVFWLVFSFFSDYWNLNMMFSVALLTLNATAISILCIRAQKDF